MDLDVRFGNARNAHNDFNVLHFSTFNCVSWKTNFKMIIKKYFLSSAQNSLMCFITNMLLFQWLSSWTG